jgi:hypothetical protein
MTKKSDEIIQRLKERALAEAENGNMTLYNSIKNELGLSLAGTKYKKVKITLEFYSSPEVTEEYIERLFCPTTFADLIYNAEEEWWEENTTINTQGLFLDHRVKLEFG